MAVNNKIAPLNANDKMVEYECNGEIVKLTPSIIKKFLVNGGGNVTDQEVTMFLNLCRFQHLNPFLREAYLVKYGQQPATIVTGKDAFTKRARRNKDYKGNQAGVIVVKNDGTLENRIGSLVLKDEVIVGGWAKVFIEGDVVPTEVSVSFDEYVGTKSDGTVNSQWSKKPATMIRKVALVQALREAFPEDFGGMYSQEEAGVYDLPESPVDTSPDEQPIRPAQEMPDDDFFVGMEPPPEMM